MAKRIQHKVHRFIRAKLGKDTTIYKCSLPGCSTYLYPETVLNKLSICTKCEREFILPNKTSLLKAKPVCPDCVEIVVRDPIIEKTIDRLLGV